MTDQDAVTNARSLAAASLAAGDPTGWFEHLYAAAAVGEATVPWDRGSPHGLLLEWAGKRDLDGRGRTALVVGSGLGDDAEFIATLGFDTEAFDVADSAIQAARQRYPVSAVRYLTADLLNPEPRWQSAYDFVFESLTVQSLPVTCRRQAIDNVTSMVAPGGTLLVIAFARDEEDIGREPPWPLSRSEVDSFASTGLEPVHVEHITDAVQSGVPYWRAEFCRPPQT